MKGQKQIEEALAYLRLDEDDDNVVEPQDIPVIYDVTEWISALEWVLGRSKGY